MQHASGSLETAVASVRRRNLGISFGMLLLLSVSVALLAAASRRAQRLADQQMEFVAGVIARAAHAGRRHPVGRREPVARRRRQHASASSATAR